MVNDRFVIVEPTGENVHRAVHLLKAGECIGLPTETVYGLAADALNPEAVAKIFSIKERPSFDPLIVHLADAGQVDQVATEVDSRSRALMEAFWPGPLTILLPRRKVLPDLVTSGLPTVAVRCPGHPVAQGILQAFGGPLAAPSANKFGRISPTTPQAVLEELGDQVEMILDGGPCSRGIESTIVDASRGPLGLLRAGAVTVEDLEKVVGRVESVKHHGPPTAPGLLKSHYAPRTTLYVSEAPFEPGMIEAGGHGYLILSNPGMPSRDVLELSSSGNLQEAAARLFMLMREADMRGYKSIIAFRLPENGLGRAINDRLEKASSGAIIWREGEWWVS